MTWLRRFLAAVFTAALLALLAGVLQPAPAQAAPAAVPCIPGVACIPGTPLPIPGIPGVPGVSNIPNPLGDCKHEPVPEMPGGGITSLYGEPDPIPQDPPGGAWRNGAPIYANYGTAGMTWHTYDNGCVPDGDSIQASIGTTIGNWMLTISKFAVVTTGALMQAAFHPTFLQVFNPLLVDATATLQHTIYEKWVPLTIAVIGVLLIWRARRAEWSAAMMAVTWALLVMVAAAAVFAWPVKAGSAADDTLGSLVGSVNGGINGQGNVADPAAQATGNLSNAVLFEEWKMGTFGRGNSSTADKYAKAIYTSTALTWQEAQLVHDDPDGKGKDLIEAKEKLFAETAAKIKDDDPDAYEYLTGRRSDARVGAAFVSLVAVACTIPFLIAASLLMIGAYLIIRLAVVFFPLIATFGVAHQFRGAVKGVGTIVAAAFLNSLMFGIGTAVTLLAVRILLDPASGLPLWLALALMGVFSVIMWVALKPMRKLTAMASPHRLFGDATGALPGLGDKLGAQLGALSKTAVAAAVTGGIGGAVAGAAVAEELSESEDRKPAGARTEGYTPVAKDAAATLPPVLPASRDREAAALAGTPVAPPPPLPPGQGAGVQHEPTTTTATVIGTHRSDMPAALPPGTPDPVTTPMQEAPALPAYGAATHRPDVTPTSGDGVDNPMFLPGREPLAGRIHDDEPAELPEATAPSIDAETGEEVFTLFVPAEDRGGSEGR